MERIVVARVGHFRGGRERSSAVERREGKQTGNVSDIEIKDNRNEHDVERTLIPPIGSIRIATNPQMKTNRLTMLSTGSIQIQFDTCTRHLVDGVK